MPMSTLLTLDNGWRGWIHPEQALRGMLDVDGLESHWMMPMNVPVVAPTTLSVRAYEGLFETLMMVALARWCAYDNRRGRWKWASSAFRVMAWHSG